MLRRTLKTLAGLVAVLAILILGVFWLANSQWGRGQIAALVEDTTADGPVMVRIGAIEGRLPDRIVLRDVVAADAEGAFARIGRLALDWQLLDLLAGRISINAVEIADALLDREPVLPEAPPEPEDAGPTALSLTFEGPGIEIALGRFSLDALTLGPAVLGEAVTVTADLSAALTDREASAKGWIEAVRSVGPPARVEIDAALVPATGVLRADLSVREPEGGLAAELLQIEGRPPLALALTGQGGLDHWQGALEGGFGPDAGLGLDLVVRTGDDGYRLAVDGTVAAARLAPADLRPLLAEPVALTLAARAGPDGSASVDRLEVSLPTATLRASAAVDADGVPVTAEADIFVPDLAAMRELTGTALSGDVNANVRLEQQGRRLAVVVGGRPEAEGIALDALALSLSAEADRALASLPSEIRFSLEGGTATPAIEGIDTVGLLGPRTELSVSGTLSPETLDATVAVLSLRSDGLTLDGRADLLAGTRLMPELAISVADLTRLRDLAGIDLSGAARVDVNGRVDLDPLTVTATLGVSGSALSLGDPALDGLIGPAPVLLTGVALDAQRRLELIGIDLATAAARASGDVSLALETGGLGGRVDLAVADLSLLAPLAATDLSGEAALAAALGGTLEAPAASASWRISDLVAAGQAVDEITGSATAAGLPDRPAGDLRVQAALRGEPVDLAVGYAVADDRLHLTRLTLDGLGVQLSGDVALDLATTQARGDVSVRVSDLGIVGSVLDLPLSAGRVDGSVRLSDGRGQGAEVTLDLADIALDDGTRLDTARLQAALTDLTGRMRGRVDLSLSGAATDGARLETAALGADIADGVALVSLEAAGEAGLPLAVSGRASVPVDPQSAPIAVDRLDATVGDVAIRQTGPLEIALAPALRVSGLDLAVDDGRVSGHAGLDTANFDIAIAIRDLPVALARLADPTLQLDGRLAGDIAVTGPLGDPSATVALSTSGVRALDPELDEIPPLVADLDLRLADRRATVALNASIGDGATASLTARVDGRAGAVDAPPVFDQASPLQATVDADLDLARVSAFLPLDLIAVAGTGQARVAAAGTLGKPDLSGTVTVAGGRLDVPGAGLYLRDMTFRAEGQGDDLVIRSFETRAHGGGTLMASGSLSADPDAGFPADIKITAREFNAVDLDIASVSVDLDLEVAGALPEYLLAGKITVLPTEIRIPDTLPPSVVEIDVVEMRDGRIVGKPVEEVPEEEANAPLRLDLEIDVPGQVFVRGRGLESEWGGGLSVSGLADAPVVEGEIAVRRGSFRAIGKTFDFDRGRVVFDGGPPEDPSLDMRLTTEVTDIQAAVVVAGSASDPEIRLESDPSLPEEDILSRLLFGSDKAELTPIQALKLARSAAILSGNFGSGPGITDQVRDALGVDTLDVDAASNDDGSVGASLSVGKYIYPGVFLKLQQGLSAESSRAVVEVEVTDNISVETDVGADSQSRVGVNYELDY